MPVGGFSAPQPGLPRPVGAHALAMPSAWRLGEVPVRGAQHAGRRVLVVGLCGAGDDEIRTLVRRPVPVSVTWRWPGTYAVVEEGSDGVVVHTDPAGALPVYAVAWGGTWAWSTSARFLAALAGAQVDAGRLTCAVLAPSLPVLAEGRSFFDGVGQLPPGCRVTLPGDGSPYARSVVWCPDPVDGPPPLRLRTTLTSAVRLRTIADPALSSDLSGGLDSTTVAVLAAAAALDGPLDAVTVHPEGVLDGADLSYARLTAAASHGRITHRPLPLTAEHRPYTRLRDVPVSDEPAPSTLTHTRLLGQLRWMRQTLGTRTHLTGDGGDSVLFQPPAHLADLVRHGHYRRAAGEAVGWARLRRTPVTPLLRDATAMARTTRAQALAHLATGSGGRQNAGNVRWFPTPPVPPWATPDALGLLAQATEQTAARPDSLPELDASVRVLVDEIREVARTAVADAELAASEGITLHNPFLDSRVIDAVLRTPLHGRPPLYAYKPTLTRAFADVLPAEVRARMTKGSFEADHYSGMRAALPELLDSAGLHLAALGLLDLPRFRADLRRAAAGVPMPLATIEQALTVDAWLHAISRTPPPTWVSPVPAPGKAV